MADIAKKHGVGATSVSNTNLEGTWGNHLSHTRAKRSLRARRKAELASASKVEKALAAGLKPRTAEDRKEAAFADELKALEATPSRAEFEDAIESHSDRIGILHTRVRNEEATNRAHRTTVCLVLVVLTALVIIALVK